MSDSKGKRPKPLKVNSEGVEEKPYVHNATISLGRLFDKDNFGSGDEDEGEEDKETTDEDDF